MTECRSITKSHLWAWVSPAPVWPECLEFLLEPQVLVVSRLSTGDLTRGRGEGESREAPPAPQMSAILSCKRHKNSLPGDNLI